MNGFEAFWILYPRRVGRLAAEKAYAKALTRASAQEILIGVEQAKRHWSDPRYIPYPATWLNQGRWMDEHQPEPVPVFDPPWVCPHVDQCNGRQMCKIATQLQRPERKKQAS